jgi:hypothetical protein
VDDLERLAGDLRRAGVQLQIVNEEHGQYLRGSLLGRFDETSWRPSSIFTEVDSYPYSFFRSGQAGNRSHVAAAQVYYVYTPCPRNVSSWAPRVRNYAPKNSAAPSSR